MLRSKYKPTIHENMDFRQIEISVYRGVRDTDGHKSTLYDFLNNVEYDKIKELRASNDPIIRKQIKLSLPQATISGVFAPPRSADNLITHSGLICVDIDRKDNPHISNFDTLIDDILRNIEEVCYASRSVSGGGYFCILPIKYPELHKQHFEALVRDFECLGIKIDRACGDVSRLRCQSYDLYQYVNLSAKSYAKLYREEKQIRPRFDYFYPFSNSDTDEKVARLCREIANQHIDLTTNYDDWMKIGAALSSLGESGRQWFHMCSSMNPSYNSGECDRKFNNLLRSTKRIGIGTFFYACRNAGLTL